MASTQPARPRETLEATRVVRQHLGVGGHKNAYRARVGQEEVVLKIVRQPLPGRSGDDQDGEEITLPERFLREMEAMRRIDNPHIVKVLSGPDVHNIDGEDRVWYVEPYYGPDSLQERIGDAWDEPATISLMLDVLAGIEALTEHNLVHRDIKPANIVFDEQGRAVLLDLGIALHVDATRLTDSQALSPRTPAYAAPEQFQPRRQANIDFRTDLFLLGIVGFETLTGRHPFDPSRADYFGRLVSGRFDRGLLEEHGCSEAFQNLMTRLLGASPNQRFRKLNFAREAIEACA